MYLGKGEKYFFFLEKKEEEENPLLQDEHKNKNILVQSKRKQLTGT